METLDRDAALVRWLAERVCGWHESSGMRPNWWRSDSGCEIPIADWSPLDSWSDAGMVADVFCAAHPELGAAVERLSKGWWARIWTLFSTKEDGFLVRADSGPRAICEAIAAATGFVWPQPDEARERREDGNG